MNLPLLTAILLTPLATLSAADSNAPKAEPNRNLTTDEPRAPKGKPDGVPDYVPKPAHTRTASI